MQKDLARTLRYMADEEAASLARHGDRAVGLEAARAAFYRGDIAQAIVAFHKQEGGWLTAQDLADYHSPIERAPSVRFAGTDVYTCGAWCQGPVLGQALNILDASALKAAGHNSADYLHTVAEALKLAFADREAFYGDPRHVDVPLEALLDRDYGAARRALIDPARASPEMPPHGVPGGAKRRELGGGAAPRREGVPASPPRDTSYICVVDRWAIPCRQRPATSHPSLPSCRGPAWFRPRAARNPGRPRAIPAGWRRASGRA